MAIKPILFNTEMVRAILDGRKTQTRRLVKPAQLRVLQSKFRKDHPEIDDKTLILNACDPPCRPGDILYVRETWFEYAGQHVYKATAAQPELWNGMWRPSIHMPKEAARIFLCVTDVRVETLCNMTISDLQKEGVLPAGYISQYAIMTSECFEQFKALWDSTIKLANISRYGWDANPWVWVIEFERCEKPEAE